MRAPQDPRSDLLKFCADSPERAWDAVFVAVTFALFLGLAVLLFWRSA